jgi:uncharacterized protein YbjT (DUF2867 family)
MGERMSQKWFITGANGNLGRRLVQKLLDAHDVVAVVRSDKAADTLAKLPLEVDAKTRLTVKVLSYTDEQALAEAAQGCHRAVHLVGILKEGGGARYVDAHEASTQALLSALAQSSITHVTYLSIVGSHAESDNACLASKGRAEDMFRADTSPQKTLASTVLRVPMVLGEGDYASFALKKRASQGLSFSFRAGSLEQPIYAGDVVAAIIVAGTGQIDQTLDLAGPCAMTRNELTHKAAQVLGTEARVVSLPMFLGYGLAWLFEKALPNPPFTAAMIGVLDHDDLVESKAAWEQLGLQPTSLEDTLTAVLTG